VAFEVGRDQQIAGTATCKELGAGGGEPPIVHETRSLGRLHRLATDTGGRPPTGQPSLERCSRVIARPERSQRLTARFETPQRAAHLTSRTTVEPAADREPGSVDHLEGHDAPRPTV
jgi:hypothetical protein